MKTFTKTCVVQNDALLQWEFAVSNIKQVELLDKNYRAELIQKMIAFQKDYIELSQQYRFIEILPKPFVEENKEKRSQYCNDI